MLFTSIKSEIGGFKNDVQFLGRSLTDIGQQWNNAKGQGAGAHLGALFGGANKKPELFERLKHDDKMKESFKGYNKALELGDAGMAKFNESIKGSDKSLKAYFAQLDGSEATWNGYSKFVGESNTAMQNFTKTTIGARVASMAMSAALSFGIGLIIQGVSWVIDQAVNYNKNAIEKMTEIRDTYKKVVEDTKNNKLSIEEDKPDFEKLSNGVDDYGRNISLTTDEYKRYQEIVSSIIDQSPSLISGYDAEGNALVNKNELLKRAIELSLILYQYSLKIHTIHVFFHKIWIAT
ncbi:MAG: hypothetical protein RR777_02950 [Christensenellaceae bacterium]